MLGRKALAPLTAGSPRTLDEVAADLAARHGSLSLWFDASQNPAGGRGEAMISSVTSTAAWPVTYTYTWPTTTTLSYPVAEPVQMLTGWRCGDCKTVLAPWVQEHRCDGGGAVVTANVSPEPPAAPDVLCKDGPAGETAAGS